MYRVAVDDLAQAAEFVFAQEDKNHLTRLRINAVQPRPFALPHLQGAIIARLQRPIIGHLPQNSHLIHF